jgi:hypothetical protein
MDHLDGGLTSLVWLKQADWRAVDADKMPITVRVALRFNKGLIGI